jgi:N-acetylmuramoyl-L-alanine amidase
MFTAIVVGHRASSPGAFSPHLDQFEYQYNTELARELSVLIESVVYFKDGLSSIQVYSEIAKAAPALVLELHFNSHSNKRAYGTETLCTLEWGSEGSLMQNAICGALKRSGGGDRGLLITQPGYRGHENVSQLAIPTLLLEPFFGSSEKDCALVTERRDYLLSGIQAGVLAILRAQDVRVR